MILAAIVYPSIRDCAEDQVSPARSAATATYRTACCSMAHPVYPAKLQSLRGMRMEVTTIVKNPGSRASSHSISKTRTAVVSLNLEDMSLYYA